MKIFQQSMMILLMLVFSTAAVASPLTVYDTQAGFYDTLHAKLMADPATHRAYVKIVLVDEAFHNACRGDQGVMRGISNERCRIKTQNVVVPGLSYDDAEKRFSYNGRPVDDSDLHTDIYSKNVDDGIGINTQKFVTVTLQAP